jgi:hypothetical protein
MTTGRKITKTGTGTCSSCNIPQQTKGNLIVDHLPWPDEYYLISGLSRALCFGSGRTSAEVRARKREKAQARSKAKRHAHVLSVREEASVLLDAILMKRSDLDEEFGQSRRDELLKIALIGLRNESLGRRQLNGVLWMDGTAVRPHKLFCQFCGFLMASFDMGVWSKLTHKRRDAILGPHLTICSLQYLAGVRTIVAPGTRIDGYEGLTFADAIKRRCGACEAHPGIPCTSIEGSRADGLGGRLKYYGYLREPHAVR